jgi:hypothetical protein
MCIIFRRGRNLYNAQVNAEKVENANGNCERLNNTLTYNHLEQHGQRINA